MSKRNEFTPEGWHTVATRIVVHKVPQFVEFLRRVFGAIGDYRPDLTTVMSIGDSMVMISEAGICKPMAAFLYVYVEDADEYIAGQSTPSRLHWKSRQSCLMATDAEWWRMRGAIFGRLPRTCVNNSTA